MAVSPRLVLSDDNELETLRHYLCELVAYIDSACDKIDEEINKYEHSVFSDILGQHDGRCYVAGLKFARYRIKEGLKRAEEDADGIAIYNNHNDARYDNAMRLLFNANEVLRSAYYIANRHGCNVSSWEGFLNRIKLCLEEEHKFMVPFYEEKINKLNRITLTENKIDEIKDETIRCLYTDRKCKGARYCPDAVTACYERESSLE